jgi:hypothetical protein
MELSFESIPSGVPSNGSLKVKSLKRKAERA